MKNNNLKISLMTKIDLEQIKDDLETDFDNFWSYSIFKSEIENKNSKYFVIKENNQILGFIGIIIVLDNADITNIVVKKIYRGLGLSTILMNYIIDFCTKNNILKINLEVSTNNTTAINLYEKFNFKRVGCRKKYYNDADALLFTKFL